MIEHSCDLCVLTETWSPDIVTKAELNSNGYTFKDCQRLDRSGGGTGIIYKSGLKVKQLDFGIKPSFEYSEWEVNMNTLCIVFVAIYRPPQSEKNPATVRQFIVEFADYISDVCSSHNNVLVSGDFNIPVNDVNNPVYNEFKDILDSLSLVQHVDFHTHEKGNILDLVITRTNSDIAVKNIKPGDFISDHRVIHATLSLPKGNFEKRVVAFRRLQAIHQLNFKHDLQQFVDNAEMYVSLEELASYYDSELRKILDKHAPVISKLVVNRPKVTWFNNDLLRLKQRKRKCERKWQKSKLNVDYEIFKEAKLDYVRALSESKVKHINSLIDQCDRDPKKLFQLVSNLTGKNTDNPLPESSSDEELANEFASFFLNKIENIRGSLACFDTFCPKQNNNISKFDSFCVVSESEIKKLILGSKPTSCALDPLPTKLVKEHIDILLPIFVRIVNLSLTSGHFNLDWKTAIVIPLLKKLGLDLIHANYRPVSNLSFISKIVEKAGLKQFEGHMDKNNLRPDYQSSYRKGFSTETALVKLANDILMNMDRQAITAVCAIDLSAAFDTVDHETLLSVLNRTFAIDGI